MLAKKSKNYEIGIVEHSINVAEKCYELADKLGLNNEMKEVAYLSGLLHDIGKAHPLFQYYLADNNVKHYAHNVLGASVVNELIGKVGNGDMDWKNILVKAVLYHHPVSVNAVKDYDYNSMEAFEDVNVDIFNELMSLYSKRENALAVKLKEKSYEISSIEGYKYYDNKSNDICPTTDELAKFTNIIRILRFADAVYNDNADIKNYLERSNKDVTIETVTKPENYDSRFFTQLDYAKQLNGKNTVFCAQTGFGKTFLGVLYTLSSDRKLYWICPRNIIAENTYTNIKNELKNLGIEDKVSVGLLLHSEWLEGDDDSDIIVTNIDNYLKPDLSNDSDSLKRTYNLLFNNCIFDEYHEYVTDAPLMAMFRIAVQLRMSVNSSTLYMSATPNFTFFGGRENLDNFINHTDEVISNKKYTLHFADDFSSLNIDGGTAIMVNSTATAQELVKEKIADKTMHSRFTAEDLAELKKGLISEYGKANKDGVKETKYSGTSLIGTGLDISFDNMVFVGVLPERFMQSTGRCNRWNDGKTHSLTLLPLSQDKRDSDRCFLKELFGYDKIADLFYEFMKNHFTDGQTVTLGDLQYAYDMFNERYKSDIYKPFGSAQKKSYENLKLIDYRFSEVGEGSEEEIIGRNALRDSNDGTFNFYLQLQDKNDRWIDTPLLTDTLAVDLKRIKKDNRKLAQLINFWKRDNGTKEYFTNGNHCYINSFRIDNNLFDALVSKASNKKTPLRIPNKSGFYHYDKKLGLMKNKA